jgi:hypothetical protein
MNEAEGFFLRRRKGRDDHVHQEQNTFPSSPGDCCRRSRGSGSADTAHEAAGELAFSVDAAGAQLNLVRRPMKNNLNGDYKPAVCLDIGISLDLPTRCWGDRL